MTRKVTRFANGQAHAISLPEKWITEMGEIDTIVMYLGNIIIIANQADERDAEVSAKLLTEKRLMTPLITDRPKFKKTKVKDD